LNSNSSLAKALKGRRGGGAGFGAVRGEELPNCQNACKRKPVAVNNVIHKQWNKDPIQKKWCVAGAGITVRELGGQKGHLKKEKRLRTKTKRAGKTPVLNRYLGAVSLA